MDRVWQLHISVELMGAFQAINQGVYTPLIGYCYKGRGNGSVISHNKTERASQSLSIVSLSDQSQFQSILQPDLQKPYHPTELYKSSTKKIKRYLRWIITYERGKMVNAWFSGDVLKNRRKKNMETHFCHLRLRLQDY